MKGQSSGHKWSHVHYVVIQGNYGHLNLFYAVIIARMAKTKMKSEEGQRFLLRGYFHECLSVFLMKREKKNN